MKKYIISLPKQEELEYGDKPKLDGKDIKIIKLLYENARISFAELSAKVKLSRDAVKYRIERMIRNKVIQGFFPLINPPKLGYPVLTIVYFSLQNFSPAIEKEFIIYVKNNKFVSNFASLTGKWDYFIVICSKDLGHFNAILKEIREKFTNIIKEYETSNIVQTYKVSMYGNLLD